MAYEVHGIINEAHEQPILCCAYNTAKKELYSGSQDASIRVWNIETLKPIRRQNGHRGWVTSLVLSHHLKILFSGSMDGTIMVWNDKGIALQVVQTMGPVFSLALNPKNGLLISGSRNCINIYRSGSIDKVAQLDREYRLQPSTAYEVISLWTTIKSHSDNVRAVCCTDTGRIYSAGYDKRLCSYDSDSPKESFSKHDKCHEGAICCMAFDSQTKTIVTGSYDGQVKIWNQAGRCLEVLASFKDTITSICHVSPANEFWIVGKDRKITVYDPRNISEITSLISEVCGFDRYKVHTLHHEPHSGIVSGITPSRQIIVWKYNPSASYRVFYGHTDWIEDMVSFPVYDGETIFTGSADKRVLRWDCNNSADADLYTYQEIPDPDEAYTSGISSMDYSEDLEAIITGGENSAIKIWYLSEKNQQVDPNLEEELIETKVLLGHEGGKVSSVRCLSDLLLVSTGYDKTIRFWDLHTKLELSVIENAHDTPLRSVEYCAANAEIATCAVDDHLVKVWCIYRHKLKYLLNVSDDVMHVKWCEKLNYWITSATDQTISFWSVEGELIRTFWHGRYLLTCMYVDSINSLLLLARADRKLEIRDLEEFTLMQGCIGHTDLISSITYLPHKEQYVTCSWDKTLRLWLLPSFISKEQQQTSWIDEIGDNDETNFVSSYEKEHPLVPPKSLKVGAQWKKKDKAQDESVDEKAHTPAVVSTTNLGKKLDDLEERLVSGRQHHHLDANKVHQGKAKMVNRKKKM